MRHDAFLVSRLFGATDFFIFQQINKGGIVLLNLIEITQNSSEIKEKFTFEGKKIKQVNFIYTKQDEALLDKFLTSLIFNYGKKNKIID